MSIAHQRAEAAESSAHTNSLENFIATIEDVIDHETDDWRVVAQVQEHLSTLVRDPRFLAPEFREPWEDHYRSHLVAVAPSRRFSVMALVWLPGQETPIHDHICWCVVGVLQGVEREERFSLRDGGAGHRWLVPAGDDLVVHVGETSNLVPPEENIHRVRNAGNDLAISIHVYGADLGVHHSSINQCFDDLPLRGEDRYGVPVPWRVSTTSH